MIDQCFDNNANFLDKKNIQEKKIILLNWLFR